MGVRRLLVVGAGQLGRGIAQVALQSGFTVALTDTDPAAAQNGSKDISERLMRLMEQGGRDPASKADVLSRLSIATDLAPAREVDVVIEAVWESVELKQRVLAELDALCPPHTILASNTSSIPITKLASATKRQDRVIGMHFMHPVPVVRLLEIVRGYLTSNETYATIEQLGRDMGREPIREAKDYAGFADIYRTVNDPDSQGYAEVLNAHLYSLYEGRATVRDVENGPLVAGMSPLAWLDLVGLDTFLSLLRVMYEEYGHSKFFACPLLKRMVEAGHLGQKTGVGFYDYSETPRRATELSPWFVRFLA